MAFSPLEVFKALQNLWLSPVVVITQVGRRPRLIFDFIWSGLNKETTCLAPTSAMRFGGAIHHIIKQVLMADPRLGPVYFSKVDLDKRVHGVVGEDERLPVRRLYHPKEKPQRPAAGWVSPLPSHGVRRQRSILLYGDLDGSRTRQQSNFPEICSKCTSSGAGRRGQSGGQRRRAGGPS